MTPADFEETTRALRRAFADVRHDRPMPTAQSRRSGWTMRAVLACVAAGAAIWGGLQLTGQPAGDAAWASVPGSAPHGEELRVRRFCASYLLAPARRNAPTESTGAGADGAARAGGPALPRRLPPLVALDWRGPVAVAVFAGRRWTAWCAIRDVEGRWTRAGGVVASTRELRAHPVDGIDFRSGWVTEWRDGLDMSIVLGYAQGATRVTVETDRLGRAEATVGSGGYFAIWLPIDVSGDGRARAYDQDGQLIGTLQPLLPPRQAPTETTPSG